MTTTEPPAADPRIAAAQAGDRAAAQALLAEALPRVRNLVRYLVPGDQDVDDMAQLALIAVLKGLPTYRGEGSFNSWVDRITVRETLRAAKKRRSDAQRRRDATPELRLLRGEGQERPTYEARRRLAACLDKLPEAQREAVVLHHAVGMSAPEVGEALGIPFETARSRLRLGMKRLRALYDDAGDA